MHSCIRRRHRLCPILSVQAKCHYLERTILAAASASDENWDALLRKNGEEIGLKDTFINVVPPFGVVLSVLKKTRIRCIQNPNR